jgi:FixJ family two-component response regulator
MESGSRSAERSSKLTAGGCGPRQTCPREVHAADDDGMVRDAVKDLLRSVGLSVESFGSAQDFLQSKRSDAPGCIVLDVRLPGASGLEFQRTLVESGIPLPVIFISGHGDISMSVRAIKSGAIEFLTKPLREQELLDAVQAGIERRRRQAKLVVELRERFNSLTSRGREVFALVGTGRPNKQIAHQLELSEMTVALRKMRARSLVEVVRMADQLGVFNRKVRSDLTDIEVLVIGVSVICPPHAFVLPKAECVPHFFFFGPQITRPTAKWPRRPTMKWDHARSVRV